MCPSLVLVLSPQLQFEFSLLLGEDGVGFEEFLDWPPVAVRGVEDSVIVVIVGDGCLEGDEEQQQGNEVAHPPRVTGVLFGLHGHFGARTL